jgi:hypothetical protein
LALLVIIAIGVVILASRVPGRPLVRPFLLWALAASVLAFILVGVWISQSS